MVITVLTEPKAGGGFRAVSGMPPGIEAEGVTREAATNQLRLLIRERACAGAEWTTLEDTSHGLGSNHPLARFAGDMKDDPLFEPWQDAIREFRKQRDEEEPFECRNS